MDNCEHLIDACASQELGDKVGIAYSLLGLAGIAASGERRRGVGRGKVDDPRRGHRVRPLRRGAADPSPKEDALLSARELEVLRLVAEGLTDSQVAERLHVSPRTVGQRLRSIYRKLGVPTRAAAAKEAVERNLI